MSKLFSPGCKTKGNLVSWSKTFSMKDKTKYFLSRIGPFVEYVMEFGTDHLYNCDTFNEMSPSSSNPEYIRKTGESIYSAMTRREISV